MGLGMDRTALATELAQLTQRVRAQQVRRNAVRAALRALDAGHGATRASKVTAALTSVLKQGPRSVAGCHGALMERKVRIARSTDVNTQRTYIRTLFHRNPVLFVQREDGRWALRS